VERLRGEGRFIKTESTMKKVTTLFFFFIQISCIIYAQNQLSGTIRDSHNNDPLSNVFINIPDIKLTALSDDAGNYFFKNIPKGIYLIQVSFIGYKTKLETVVVKDLTKKDFLLDLSVNELQDVNITGVIAATDKQKNPVSVATFNHNDILENSSTNVIDAITKVPGVSAITNGQSISKPVIRGLSYNRVLTINDDVELVDQAWFDEFGIEADPNAVNRYEILKGPASLAYGSDAIAGVINLIPEEPAAEEKIKAEVLFNYQTNNGLINNMLHIAGTKKGISWSARIDYAMAHAYQNHFDGYVLNSQFSNFNTDATLGIHRKWGYSQVHASYFDLQPGIVDGTRDSSTGKLAQIVSYPDLNSGEPTYELPTNQQLKSYTPLIIYQKVQHTKLVWDNSIAIGDGRIKGIFSWQKNQRREHNDPTIPDVADIYYLSNAATYDVRYISAQKGGFNFSSGINGVYQSSKSLGTLLLIPDYKFFQIGAFIIANRNIGNLNLSGGLRYDTRTFKGLDHWVDSTTQAPAKSTDDNVFHEFQGFTSKFNGYSFNLGAAYNFTKNIYAKVNIARGWRAPNVAECAANGVHDGTVVYEIGEHSLKPEASLEEDVAFGINSKDISFEIDAFNNSINGFIYAQGLQSVFGGDSINNSLNAAGLGAAPVYKFTNGKAQLYGGEVSLNLHPSSVKWIELKTDLSMVYGGLKNVPDSEKYLPFVPPTRVTAELKFNFNTVANAIKNAYFKIGVLNCFQQNQVYYQDAIYSGLNTALTSVEYAASRSATKGYTLLNAGIGGDIVSKGKTFFQLYIICNNLLDQTYMDYMSRFKYLPVNNTTGRVGVFNMGRNLSVKLLIPIDLSSGK
jgi:iron complex outermembrane receptor protein